MKSHSFIYYCDGCLPIKCTNFLTLPEDTQPILMPTLCPYDPNKIPKWYPQEKCTGPQFD
jgi:hypothetical protein